MDTTTRRRFLSAATTAAIAGCTSGRRDPPDSTGPADSNGDDPESGIQADSPYADVYESAIDSVAFVGDESGGGSGFVYDGYVITNQHVVDDASEINVRFHEGEWRTAAVSATDAYADLAVLSTALPGYADDLSFVDELPPIGTEVLALGSPFGLESSVSLGIISGRNRSLPSPTGFSIPNTVQTDAGLEPGNSGGPLLTLDGDVAGVAVAAVGSNVGFAVSPLLARRILPELAETGSYEHPFLGIRIAPVTPTLAEANDLPAARGVYVVSVIEEGPTSQPFHDGSTVETVDGETVYVGGDVLVELAGRPIDSDADLGTVIALELSPGDRVDAVVLRDGDRVELTVDVGARPEP
ncbi:MAG: S1C family serine protease [Natronomonas sp.]